MGTACGPGSPWGRWPAKQISDTQILLGTREICRFAATRVAARKGRSGQEIVPPDITRTRLPRFRAHVSEQGRRDRDGIAGRAQGIELLGNELPYVVGLKFTDDDRPTGELGHQQPGSCSSSRPPRRSLSGRYRRPQSLALLIRMAAARLAEHDQRPTRWQRNWPCAEGAGRGAADARDAKFHALATASPLTANSGQRAGGVCVPSATLRQAGYKLNLGY